MALDEESCNDSESSRSDGLVFPAASGASASGKARLGDGPTEPQMRIQYREVKTGVLEGTYDVEQLETADAFAFVLEGLLGRAIYI